MAQVQVELMKESEFSAERMRQVAFDSDMCQLMDEWRETRRKIEQAAYRGCYSVTFNQSIRKETRQRLESLGFEVKSEFDRNESYTNIKWGEL